MKTIAVVGLVASAFAVAATVFYVTLVVISAIKSGSLGVLVTLLN